MSLDDPETIAPSRKILSRISVGEDPHKRIVATQALEMIQIGELVREVKNDSRLFSSNKSKLEFLERYPDSHIHYAARVALEDFEYQLNLPR